MSLTNGRTVLEGTVEMSGNECLMKSVGYPVFTVNNQFNYLWMFSERSSISSKYQLSVSKCLSPSNKLSLTLIYYRDWEERMLSHMSHLDQGGAKSGKDLLERS